MLYACSVCALEKMRNKRWRINYVNGSYSDI